MKTPRLSRPAITLLIVLIGYLTFPMGMTGTALALPEIGRDLDASGTPLQWVVTGYVLTASSVMLVAGSLGDMFGRRRVYATGAGVYALGTFAAASAQNILVLDAARTLTGIGAAGVMAGGGSLLATVFQGPSRTRVFAAVGTVAGIGMAAGPTLSGWLVSGFGWRATFLVFGTTAALVFAASFLVPESRAAERPKVDRPGVVTFVTGLALLMYGVTQASLVPSLAGLVTLAAFVAVERRSDHPVLDFSLVRNRRFMGWVLGAMAVSSGATGVLVFFPTYLQGGAGFGAQQAGLILLAATAPIFAFPSVGGWLVNHGFAPRHLLVTALLLSATGNAWLALSLTPGANAVSLALPLVLIGSANGLSLGQLDAQAMSLVEQERVGLASGLLNTARGGAGALVLAGVGAALTGLVALDVDDSALAATVTAGQRPDLAAPFAGAWQWVAWTTAALMLLAALGVRHLLRPAPEAQPVPVPEPVPAKSPVRV